MPPAATDPKQKLKLGIAIGALVLAGIIIAWQMGVFGGGPPPTPPEVRQQVEQQTQKIQQDVQRGRAGSGD